MATLYVENVPDDLYRALRDRARQQHRSVAAEVIQLIGENVPTPKELRARREFWRKIKRWQTRPESSAATFPAAEEMLREDRAR
jgi:plasmid stability protein